MRGTPRTLPVIHDYLRESAERRPESVLLVDRGRRAMYGEVEAAANRLARLLVDQGVQRGDRVGLLLPNSQLYVEAYYGALKAGAIAVPLHANSDAHTVQQLLQDCRARALVSGAKTANLVSQAASGLPALSTLILPDGEVEKASFPGHLRVLPYSTTRGFTETSPNVPPLSEQDRAMIIYTSGSTGKPRGATLSHRNIASNTWSIVSYLQLTQADRVSVVLPFPYVYGSSLLNTHVSVGGSVVLHGSLMFPNVVLDEIEKEEVTGFSGVPSTFAILLNRSDLAKRSFRSLRYVTQAGGGMPVAHVKRLVEALPGVRVFVMYGATEASARLSYLEPEALSRKMGSIGKAIPGVEITVRRDDGSEAEVGEVGELVAQGSNIMECYWGDDEATAEVLDENGFHTGDLGWRDEEGFLWVRGRKREMIKSGAHRISPREIEEALLEAQEVDEAAVVGVPDDYLGEAIVAHLTLRSDGANPQATSDALLDFCRGRLPPHKVPREIRIRESLPRNPSGKIDKRTLRAEGPISV